ncbi:MAG: hypothetical protein ACTHOB_07185 [Ginsengibacter sp.]
MSKHQTYKEALQSALNCLEEAQGHALSAVLNIAFAGEYKELGSLYEVGETLQIEPAAFEDTGDANIDLILKVIYEIDSVKDSISNLSGLEREP